MMTAVAVGLCKSLEDARKIFVVEKKVFAGWRKREMRKKQRNITFRETDDEYKVIKEKAGKENLTVTDFIVTIIIC